MKKSKFTGEQIAFALRQAVVGTPVAEVCRKMGISEATFYRWKQLYGGPVTFSPDCYHSEVESRSFMMVV